MKMIRCTEKEMTSMDDAAAHDASTALHAEEVTGDVAEEASRSKWNASEDSEPETEEPESEESEPEESEEEEFGARFESFWNRCWSSCCAYHETTTIPAMCYTYDHSDHPNLNMMDSLQVISVKIASIGRRLRWPLQVFGTFSVRDVLDRKRNIVFHRERDDCQTITQQDPYLTLTGPTRAAAVCVVDRSYIEILLKVKGATESDDINLSHLAFSYVLSSPMSGLYPGKLSTLDLRFHNVLESVEATVHVKVTGGSWPDGLRGVISAAPASHDDEEIKLLDIGSGGLPVDADGMVKLSRCVVSVGITGMLKVSVLSCSDDKVQRCQAKFEPHRAGVSCVELRVGSCSMAASVAWSLFCRG